MDDEQIEYFSLNERRFRVRAFCHFCRSAITFCWMNQTYTHLCKKCSLYICTECTAETSETFSENLRRKIQTSLCTSCFKKAKEKRENNIEDEWIQEQNKTLEDAFNATTTKLLIEEKKIINDDDDVKDFISMVTDRTKSKTSNDDQTLSVNIKAMHSRLVDYYNQQHINSEQSCKQRLQVESRIKQLADANRTVNDLQDSVNLKAKPRRMTNNNANDLLSNISTNRKKSKAKIVIPKQDDIYDNEIIPEDKKIRGRKKKQSNNEEQEPSDNTLMAFSEKQGDKITLNNLENCVSNHPFEVETLLQKNKQAENFINAMNKVDVLDRNNSKKSPQEVEFNLKKAAKIKLMKKKCEKYLQYQKEHPEEFYKVKK